MRQRKRKSESELKRRHNQGNALKLIARGLLLIVLLVFVLPILIRIFE